MRFVVASICLWTGCGRIGFDPRSDSFGARAISLVQQTTGHSPKASTIIVTLDGAVSVGDMLVMTASTDTHINGVSSVTGGGVSWSPVASVSGRGSSCSGCIRGTMWFGLSSSGGTNAVTVAFNGSDDLAVSVTEWSGIGALDAVAMAGPFANTTITTGWVTTTQPNDLVLAIGAWDNSGISIGPTDGFVALTPAIDVGTSYLAPASRIVSTPGSFGTVWTLSGATQAGVGIAAAFKSI